MAERKRLLLQGNASCVQGALYAGMRFFAGYPITPSTEVAELSSRELPKVGGKFIQMEDELASMAAIIGASVSGAKVMTGTSGPGFSLMQENIGYAYMTEVPAVVVNVQRGGPSTGLPTKVSQSDTMQARWGPHGDFNSITVAPSTVGDTFSEVVRAFNLAERFRTPVTVLMDEVIAHSREIIEIPEPGELEIVNRVKPTCKPEDYKASEYTENGVTPMPAYGEGYRYHLTGLTHDEHGFPTNRSDEIPPKMDKMRNKILNYMDEITKLRVEMMDDADIVFITYGSVSRAALQAASLARKAGVKVGCIQLYTIWPFPDDDIRDICSRCKKVIVGELNMGQIVHEVRRVMPEDKEIHTIQRYDGEILTPIQMLEKIEEVL
ncbi:MAG: 2-oxoacid:acceptor oxidoreductase subunit alpha [candidate division Zixibacteria bacterium]|nr:2-oxoacid:acceptor oxidoreductase subunit alpha [candidate division Zixibacteria bacterium]